jgi:chromosome segregation ATPase
MFGAIWRYIRAIGYYMTGRIDAARKVLDTNPHVVRSTYDNVVREKKERVNHYKEAVATLIAQKEKKVNQIQRLTEDVEKLERLKMGAMAKAKQRIAQLQAEGLAAEKIPHDEEYIKCQGAFQDFSSTLAEKQSRISELEGDVGAGETRIGEHKVQLQHLLREIEAVKEEAADTVADMITAREEKEVADLLTGLSEDRTNAELSRMRDLRQQVKAEASISKELAGTDTRAQEAEFLDYARVSTADDEFAALVGLAKQEDAAPRESDDGEKESPSSPLPE